MARGSPGACPSCAMYSAARWSWPTQPDQLAVIGSELQSIAGTDVLELTAVIRNRAAYTQALPALEVTLSDTQNRPSGAQDLQSRRLSGGGRRTAHAHRRRSGGRRGHDDSHPLRDPRNAGCGLPRLPLLYIEHRSSCTPGARKPVRGRPTHWTSSHAHTHLRFDRLRHGHGVPGPVRRPHPPGSGPHPECLVSGP